MLTRIKRGWSSAKTARQGWWGNKPPTQRQVVGLGVVVSVALLAVGLALDRDALGLDSRFPSLTSFTWDIARATTLGTLVAAVWDDVRTWGDRWHVLQANAGAVAAAVDDLMDEIASVLNIGGLGRGMAGEPALTAAQVQKFTTWFRTFEDEEYDHRFKKKGDSPYRTLDALNGCLERHGLAQVRPSVMQPSLTGRNAQMRERNQVRLQSLVDVLEERIQNARVGYSTGLSAKVDRLLRDLDMLVHHLHLVEKAFVELADGQVRDTQDPGTFVPGCWTQFHALADFLRILTHELETGRPYPYQDIRWNTGA